MKRILCTVLSVVLLCMSILSFASCGSAKPIIGIIQFGSHGSLNNCYDGIIRGLTEAGIDLEKYDVQHLNSNFDADVSATQAKKLVNSRAKVIIAIATPSAIAAATEALGSSVPVVYCAVTDASTVSRFDNITGTSDIPDAAATLKLVRDFFGRDDVKIGILSSTEESSDALQLTNMREAAKAYPGMTIETETVADITLIDTYTERLIGKGVDCFVNLLDNTVVGKLSNILVKTDAAGIPVFGSEIEQVKIGCLASASIEYLTVGALAGGQAAQILGGKAVSEVAPRTMENQTFPCYSASVLAKFAGLTLPEYEGMINVDNAQ